MLQASLVQAGLNPEPLTGRIDGIAQVQQVPAFSLSARPRYVLCGDGVPCPAPTVKTLDIRPVLAQAEPKASGAPKTVSPQPARQEVPNEVVVHFAFGKADLSSESLGILHEFAKRLGDKQGVKVEGYTDKVGGKSYNDRLARRRAEAVKQNLVRLGIDPERIRMSWAGKCCYVQSNKTEAGRAANRRAEVGSSISVTTDLKE